MDLDALTAAIPFAATIGIELVAASPEEVIGRIDWRPDRTTAGGGMHGGAIMTLADSVGAVCAFLNLPVGASTSTTTSSSTMFTRAVRGGTVIATAHRVHAGRSTIVVVTEVRDDAGRLVAQTTQSQAVLSTPRM
ncbi:MAG TPA: PaaI family thioesterase [Aldersonia sp.]